ncbi:hypothetical protein B1991_18440 [Rhodanobacter lindaniclasticus]|uniref:Uncharacterized protein n=1 Tax=Rhodanobacter lindaniclasticus TaxID=75310 RepID=A0A4S3K5H8_9GAMM|nr:hypothetical protein B1991_18440 [Rhodanobacter lindaniclasticus]
MRQLALRGFQFGHAGIEIGQQLFELFDDAGLFALWWCPQRFLTKVLIVPPVTSVLKINCPKLIEEKLGVVQVCRREQLDAIRTDSEWKSDVFKSTRVVAEEDDWRHMLHLSGNIIRITAN